MAGEVRCLCGTAAAQRTVQKEGPNQGRPFWACGRPWDGAEARCDFFEWADAGAPAPPVPKLTCAVPMVGGDALALLIATFQVPGVPDCVQLSVSCCWLPSAS